MTKRKKQLESAKKTHKEAERQGLPRVITDRDEKIEEEKEEPKDWDKQTAKENKVGLSLKKEQELKKNQTVARTEKKSEN